MNTALHPPALRRKLSSWKEIADYLQRDVRTVTRWEQEKGLPVHREPSLGRHSVFAFTDEIDAWLKQPAPMAAYAAEPVAGKTASTRKWAIAIGTFLLLGALIVGVWIRTRPPAPDVAGQPVPLPSVLRFSWPRGVVEFTSHRIDLGAYTPAAIIASDFNQDGIPDLATVYGAEAATSVMLGRGDGTFAPPTVYGTCSSVSGSGVAAGLDGDAALDLVIGCHEAGHVRVLWGGGSRPFAEYTDLPSGEGPRGLAIADLNGDGRLDLIAGSMIAGSASVFLNLGSHKFTGRSFPLVAGVCYITIRDLDGDGKLDVLASSATGAPITLLKGRGDGSFNAPQTVGRFQGGWLHLVADLDGDALPEIVTNDLEGEVLIMRVGSATVQRLGVQVPGWYPMLAADFNGDGRLDILGAKTWQNSLLMLAGDAEGNLVSAGSQPVGRYPLMGATADFNRDGLLDAVFPLAQERALMVLLQKKPGN